MPGNKGIKDRQADPLARRSAIANEFRNLEPELLRRRWRSVMGRPMPPHLSPNLVIRILIWREQIAVTGDLDAVTLAALAAAQRDDVAPESSPKTSKGHRMRPGTVLLREHQGVLHRVIVLDKGFVWNARTYSSLSRVARVITGTNWNGNRFFGIKEKVSLVRGSQLGVGGVP